MVTTPRLRAFILNFFVGILFGFGLSYMYLGTYVENARLKAQSQIQIDKGGGGEIKQHVHKDERHFGDHMDAHDHDTLEHVHGPVGDVKFHGGDDDHHKGKPNRLDDGYGRVFWARFSLGRPLWLSLLLGPRL